MPGIFDFADRNGVLFEWNDDVDECPEGILEEDDVILYPSIAVELPGVDLKHNSPRPSIEPDLIPHGQAEDAAMRNANQEPFNVVGVEPVTVIHAKDGEIDSDSDEDDNNGIIAINNAPLPVAQDPLILSDSSDNEQNNDDHSDNDSEDDDDDDPSFADTVAEQDDSGDDEDKEKGDQGVR